ncbi:hypothetical protein BGW36DRAFT_364074 [Talaromyces proteolyticus]|uniref:Annexin n=1 Tax=Talaromyces proteolyticus TaxID=1131652 RepID=A0AAD4KGE2_9EURO|nr:uncharacterized protein BGW36DRAFT_364074 [Talaromyces proteolyticus]KAH8690498.1 hypothetical protein BGW36DRAFT_364074 [Talaromyces proteolyticus]
MSSLQVNDPRSRGRSKSPSGRKERSRSRDVRAPSPSVDLSSSSRTGKKYYDDSDSAEEKRREKRREAKYSSRSGRETKESGSKYEKYDLSDSSDEERYRAKERAKDRYYHSEEEDDSKKRYYEKSSSRSSKYQDEDDKRHLASKGSSRGRHSPTYGSDSEETESDSDLSALAYGDARDHRRNYSSQDPRSSRDSISKSHRVSSTYRPDDTSREKPGAHPSYSTPDQFAFQQPGQYPDPRLYGHNGVQKVPPVLPPDWAPIPPSEMPGYVPPSTHPTSTQAIPGAFPGGYPATAPQQPNPYSQAPAYTSTSSYANPPQWQYANPDPNIKYGSKNDRPNYTQSNESQFAKPYTASTEPQFLEIAPGRSRAESTSRHGRPHSLSVSSNLSVGGMSHTGGRPPASPLLEAYKGTYQSISPMPSPIMNPAGLAHDDDISDLEGLGGSGSDRRRKHKYSKSRDDKKEREREKELEKDRKKHGRHSSRAGEEVILIAPSSRKKVMFYDPVPDAIALKEALSHRTSVNTTPLLEILPSLTSDEILTLRQEYKTHAKVQGKGINIAKHIKMRLGSTSFAKVCYATALGRWESEAYWANCYYQAGTSRRELLIESLIGRSNSDIREIKNCFRDARYSDDLEKCMKAELKADKFRTAILLSLSERRQPESQQIDLHLVKRDIAELHRALVSREGGETAMINIILLRSDYHLREIMNEFDTQLKRNFAKEVIKKSPNLVGETLVHVLNGAINRPMRDALLLHQAIRESRPGKERSELLISRLVRLHWEPKHLELVKEEYRHRYKERVEEAIAQEIITSSGGSEWGEFCVELARSSSKLSQLK